MRSEAIEQAKSDVIAVYGEGVRCAQEGSQTLLRIESVDLPPEADRIMTVLVNALTGRASLTEGEDELPPSRDASEFK